MVLCFLLQDAAHSIAGRFIYRYHNEEQKACLYAWVCVCLYTFICTMYVQVIEEARGCWIPWNWSYTDGCVKPPDMGVGNENQVLYKSSKCS